MKTKISKLEELPEALNYLMNMVESLEMKVDALRDDPLKTQKEQEWMDIDELCQYLPTHPAKQTVYTWVNEKIIPYYKSSKKLLFLRSEIDDWLRQGRRKNNEELKREAEAFIIRKKGRGR